MVALEHYLQHTTTPCIPVIIISQVSHFKQSAVRVKRFANIGLSIVMVLDSRYAAANYQLATFLKTMRMSHICHSIITLCFRKPHSGMEK